MIERLQASGLISKVAIRRYVLGKDVYRLFPITASGLPLVVAQPSERLATSM